MELCPLSIISVINEEDLWRSLLNCERHTNKPKHACSLAKSKTKNEGLTLNALAEKRNWGMMGKVTGEAFSDLFFTSV